MAITFREFVELVEGKKKKNKKLSPSMPPNVVPGTYHSTPEYTEYTLAPHTGPIKPFKKPKDVTGALNLQGGTGGKAIKKVIKQREEQQEGFSIKTSQRELEKQRKEAKERIEKEAEQRNNAARNAFRHEGGMVSYEKDPKTGKVVRGRRTKGGFTPDT